MDSSEERKIWKNWNFLKNEVNVDDFLDKMVEYRAFSSEQREEVMNVQPPSRPMKTETFLHAVIKSGSKAWDIFCSLLVQSDDNKYSHVVDKLDINRMVVTLPPPGL